MVLISSAALADELDDYIWLECTGTQIYPHEQNEGDRFHILRVFDEDNVRWFDGKNETLLAKDFWIYRAGIVIGAIHWTKAGNYSTHENPFDRAKIVTLDRFTGEYHEGGPTPHSKTGTCNVVERPERKF